MYFTMEWDGGRRALTDKGEDKPGEEAETGDPAILSLLLSHNSILVLLF